MRLINELLGVLSVLSFLGLVCGGIVTLIIALLGRTWFLPLQFSLWSGVVWLAVSAILYKAHKDKLEK
jgi:hypothetical protein